MGRGTVGAGRNPIHLSAKDSTVQTQPAPLIIELRPALWMVKEEGRDGGPGVIRGYLSAVEAADGIRYLARLPHLNPTQGLRLGEFWEWDRAVEAVLADHSWPIPTAT